MTKIVLIQLFYFSCLVTGLQAQEKSFFWTKNIIQLTTDTSTYQTTVYGTQDGLASSEITCLAQDSKGFMWIGTSAGLSRYDGVKFENFLKAGKQFQGKIYAICEDVKRNVIWIACDAGLCYFSNNNLGFVNFKESDVAVYDIFLPGNNQVWIGTVSGPALLNEAVIADMLAGKTVSLKSLILPQWQPPDSSSRTVYKIAQSKSGNIYFAHKGSVYLYNNNKPQEIWVSEKQKNNNDVIVGMVPGNGDSVYFASVLSGSYLMTGNKIKRIADDGSVAGDLVKHANSIYYFTWNGIYQLDSLTQEWKKISVVPPRLNIWISRLCIDNENNLWIGLHDNLLYQKPGIFFTYRNKPDAAVPELFSICRRKDNQMLFGGNRGKIYRREGTVLKNIFGTGGIVPDAEVKVMYEDSRGWFWLGTGYQGVSIIKNRDTFHFTKSNGLASNSNYFFYEDGHANIYTGGDGGFSRISFDVSDKNFHFKNFLHNEGDNVETFRQCVEGPDGSLWLGGQKGIFHLLKDSLFKYSVNGEVNLSITDIKKDSNGDVWVSTRGDGIWQCFFDADNLLRARKMFSTKDGLQSNVYLRIVFDKENNVWAGSYSGISLIRKANGNVSIKNYTSTDGFLSSNYQALQFFCDNSDTIWVATSAGLTSFYAADIKPDKKLLFNFSSVSLADTSKKIVSYATGDSVISAVLPYFINGIDFKFKAICLSDSGKINYSYRLVGAPDSSWTEWSNKESAPYRNLTPGTYSFQVKASVGNSSAKTLTFRFKIDKPFWLRWWFILAGNLLGLAAIYLIQKKWKKNIQKKHDEKIRTQKLISENLQYQLEVEQVTNYFTTSMSKRETVDDLLWDVARQCISKLNFEDCVIYIKDVNTSMLIQKAAWGPKGKSNDLNDGKNGKIISPIEIPLGKGIVGTVASTGIAEIIPDVTIDSRYIKDDAQRYSEIAVPVIYDNMVLGVIDSESNKKNFYSQRHLKILTTIASHCAERIVKLRTEENLQNNQLELLQAQNRLAEEKLTALRSQMNPHFIFNCLNSIQQFILTGEVDNANKYLSQFSKLIRLVLQYSENNFISLEEEINMLQLYLSLEKTRFGNSFEYKIFVDEELDTDEIKIPNLMIQPFVENAIWHGLMHKEGDRKIDISFELKNDESIVCIVTDNGIGRKRAAEIRKTKSVEIKHQSKGMQLIKDKIDVLKQQFKSDVLIEIYDVANIDGDVQGTKVLIQLPLQYQDNGF